MINEHRFQLLCELSFLPNQICNEFFRYFLWRLKVASFTSNLNKKVGDSDKLLSIPGIASLLLDNERLGCFLKCDLVSLVNSLFISLSKAVPESRFYFRLTMLPTIFISVSSQTKIP